MSSAAQLPPADYERTDGSPRGILFTGAGLAAGIGAVLLVSALMYRAAPPPRFAAADTLFQHGVRARTTIARDWAEQDRLVHEHLETYGWIDRSAGIVRIPIERAMDVLVTERPEAGKTEGPP
jgi:hypothetical protein